MNARIALLGCTLLLSAVPQAVAQVQQPIELDLDHASFAYDGDSSLLEVYLAFNAVTLPYEAGADGYRADLPLDVAVLHSTEATLQGTPSEPVWQDTASISFVVPDTANLVQGQFFLHQERLPILPGEYELRVVIASDSTRGRPEVELRRDVLVPDFADNDVPSLSDITLASSIAPSDDRNAQFYKNGLLIQPNANQLYGQGMDRLYYYAELYNVDQIESTGGTYTLLSYIAEANRPTPIAGLQRRSERPVRSPDVLAGSFQLNTLPSGSYFLRLVLLDANNQSIVEQARKFFVFNPHVAREAAPAPEMTFETSPFATMSEEEVDRGIRHASVIASNTERRRARGIKDLDERRRFLMEFWQQRDPDPSTPINEFREEFYARVQYANERYANRFTEGWETDRGQVLIKYGMPTQIEPHLFDRGYKPYEIWTYNNITGESGESYFYFADLEGYGEFRLLHSTVTGERKNLEWESEIHE